MAIIVDKRKVGKNKSADNRARFIKRYKSHIKDSVETAGKWDSIKKPLDQRRVKIKGKDVSEPSFHIDPKTGKSKRVLPGNDHFSTGDKVKKDSQEGSKKGYEGEGEDDFSFLLTKDEFMDIYFEDMCLPNFIKESLKGSVKWKMKRAGFSKDGVPPRLDLPKTFKQALARRIATKSTRFLDDIDLRYKHFIRKPFPVKQAHIFFLMDVSWSMEEFEKTLAKKFFLLFYLFLGKEYDKVEITFIRHTTEAEECKEFEFFYGIKTGGTLVSEGLKLVNDIIEERINTEEVNVYVAQASDGDDMPLDELRVQEELLRMHDKVQYIAYIQVEALDRVQYKQQYEISDLFDLYDVIKIDNSLDKLNIKKVSEPSEVYPVFKELFKKE